MTDLIGFDELAKIQQRIRARKKEAQKSKADAAAEAAKATTEATGAAELTGAATGATGAAETTKTPTVPETQKQPEPVQQWLGEGI